MVSPTSSAKPSTGILYILINNYVYIDIHFLKLCKLRPLLIGLRNEKKSDKWVCQFSALQEKILDSLLICIY